MAKKNETTTTKTKKSTTKGSAKKTTTKKDVKPKAVEPVENEIKEEAVEEVNEEKKNHVIIESLRTQLTEEKWTRATIENYSIKDFAQMDDIIKQAEQENLTIELQEVCIEHLSHNPKSIIALYIAGVISFEEDQLDNTYLYQLIKLFRENRKWSIIEFLAKKILEYGEDKFALLTLQSCHEYHGDIESLYSVWERIVKVDFENAEIAKKIGDLKKNENALEEAIYYYKIALKRYTRKQSIQLIEDIWLALAELIPEEIDFFYGIEKDLLKIDQEKTADLLSVLLDYYMEKQDWDRSIELLKKITEYNIKDKNARKKLVDCLKEKYKDHSLLEEYLKISGINQNTLNLNEALNIFEKHIAFDEGNYVYHRHWGLGEIVEIWDEKSDKLMTIDFESKKNHQMTLNMALNSLKVLPKNHLWLQKKNIVDDNSLEQLRDDSDEGIKNVLMSYFESFGNQATMKEIKAELVPDVISAKGWSKWWTKAKKVMKTTPIFGVSPTKKDLYFIREKGVTHEEETLQNFNATHNFYEKLKIFLDFIKHSEDIDSETFRDMFTYFVDIINKSEMITEYTLHSFLVLRRLRKEYPSITFDIKLTPMDLVKMDFEQLKDIYSQLTDFEYKKEILNIIRKNDPNWVEKFLQLLKSIVRGGRAHNFIVDELIRHGQTEALAKVINEMQDNMRQEPENFIWSTRLLLSNSDVFKSVDIPYPNIVFNLLRFLDLIHRDIDNKKDIIINRRLHAQVHDILIKDEVLKNFLEEVDANLSRRLYMLFKGVVSLDEVEKAKLVNRLVERFPKLMQEEEEEIPDSERLHPFMVTKKMYETKQKELQHLLNVEIPKNSKDIGLAQEKGDLRENAEYISALERQKYLQSISTKLSEELAKVKIVDLNKIDTSKITFGTTVTLLNLEEDKEETFTILSEWESNLENNIISYKSPLGNALLGAQKGDEITFSFASEERRYKVLNIKKTTEEVISV